MAKQKPRFTRQLLASYLYPDGTLVQTFEERRDGTRLGQTAEITLGYTHGLGVYRSGGNGERDYRSVRCPGGRVVVSHIAGSNQAMVALAKGCKVEAVLPSVYGGSENTRKAGIPVGYFSIRTKRGELDWTVLGSMISGPVTIQDGGDEWPEGFNHAAGHPWQTGDYWGGSPVAKITDLRPVRHERVSYHIGEEPGQAATAAHAVDLAQAEYPLAERIETLYDPDPDFPNGRVITFRVYFRGESINAAKGPLPLAGVGIVGGAR